MADKTPELNTSDVLPLVVEEVDVNRYEVRRGEARDVSDPHVSVVMYDTPPPLPHNTRITTSGVQYYDKYDRYGTNSTVGIGRGVRIEITTRLLDDLRKLAIAEKVASLVFELADDQNQE